MVRTDKNIKIRDELEEIRKNEALLAKLLENSSQPFGVGYPDGHLGLVNKAFEELTGYSREELKNTDWSEILTPPEFRDMENEILEELQRTGQPVRYEKEYIKKDGTRVPIELLVHIVKNKDETPEYYYSFITDISERKKAEKSLNKSENRYYQLFGSMNEGVALHEIIYNAAHEAVDYIITDINQAYEEILGLNRNNVVGKKASWRRATARSTTSCAT
jgi:PAS domain S-box-containing protein